MIALWFALLCFTIIVFVVLDGWNIGVGTLHFLVARNERERRDIVAALGPLWSWNEVWLIAAGGTFILAFPMVMAAAFSGFYLALWMVLWSFVLRGISIEVGGHIADMMWRSFWDFVFAISNLLLAILFGAALGNVIRGVPIDASRRFSMALFTDFSARGVVGILDWYTMSVAVFATVLLAAHGATYLRLKTTGAVHQRSQRCARILWTVTHALFPAISIETWLVRPELYRAMVDRPAAWIFLAMMAAGGWALWSGFVVSGFSRTTGEARAFIGSCLIVAGLLGSAAAAAFPVILHSTLGPQYSLTAYAGATTGRGLTIALIWWPIAAGLAFAYVVPILRKYRGAIGDVAPDRPFP